MPKDREEEIKDQIIEKAKQFGACSAGIANVEALKKFPFHRICGASLPASLADHQNHDF